MAARTDRNRSYPCCTLSVGLSLVFCILVVCGFKSFSDTCFGLLLECTKDELKLRVIREDFAHYIQHRCVIEIYFETCVFHLTVELIPCQLVIINIVFRKLYNLTFQISRCNNAVTTCTERVHNHFIMMQVSGREQPAPIVPHIIGDTD